MHLGMPFHIDVGWLYASPGAQEIQAARLCLMTYDHPSSSWSHSRGFQWGSGLEIGLVQGLDLVVLHPHLDWPGCVELSIVLLEKPILRFGEHCQSRRKQRFVQDNLVRGLIHASFTKTNLPDSSLAEAPPDHHLSSTKFHSRWETWSGPQATVCCSHW